MREHIELVLHLLDPSENVLIRRLRQVHVVLCNYQESHIILSIWQSQIPEASIQ